MAGGMAEHNRICLNAASVLLQACKGSGCRPFVADMLVRIDDVAYNPDVFVSCDAGDKHRLYRTRPCLVIEVLSTSTQAVDRGERLYNYRRCSSVQTILLIEQDRRRVDVYRRQDDGFVLTTLDHTGSIELSCPPGTSLTLDQLYEGVDWPEPAEASVAR